MASKSDFLIRFVSTANSRKEEMQNAVKGVQAAKVPTEKVQEEAVLQMTTKDSNLYVCDPFEGKAFDHLLKLGCRVIGAQCVLSCLELDISLPRVNHPVHNLSLFGAVVTCSSLAKQQRESIHRKVEWMSGVVSKDLTECITHLIAGEVGSKKYHVAADLKKPILLPSWVDACWEEGQTKYLKGTNSDIVSVYKCPIFKGCNICVTGFQVDEKKKIESAITENGGIYSKELKFQESTHLIVCSAKGAKYEHAKKWKIHCVSLQWLFDGVEHGYSCDEALYPPPEAECHTSTPVKDKGMSDFRSVNVSTISNISSFSNVDETAMTTLNITGVKGQVLPDALMTLEAGLRAFEELKLDKAHEMPFLDGCKIYISEFTADLVEKVRRVINAGGGTRLSQLNEAVTHILVADRITQIVRNFHSKSPEVHILNSMWLVESYSNGQRQSEERYILPEFTKTETLLQDEEAVTSKGHLIRSSTSTDEQPDMLLNQYRPIQGDGCDEDGDGEVEFPLQDEEKTMDEDETVMEIAGTDGMFANKIFTILGFNSWEIEHIQSQIMDSNGKILTDSSRAIPNYAVVPCEGCEVKRTVDEVVTICWLEMCNEAKMFLPTSSNVLFKPVVLSSKTKPLSDCVVTFSQYSGVEKQYLNQLAENLGASCQDYFQRKAKKDSKANTHLVLLSPEGSKYEAAKKWDIPTVTTKWIFQCAKEGQRVPEEKFPVDGVITHDTIDSPNSKAVNEPSPEFPIADDNLVINPGTMDVDVTPIRATSEPKIDPFKTPNIGTLNLNSVKRPCSNSLEKSAKRIRRGDFGRIATPMLGTPATPGMFLRASQDFLPKLGIDTPVSVKANRRKSSLPYEVCLYENLISAVEATGGGNTELDESQHVNGREGINKENERISTILNGLVVYVAERLSHQRGELHKQVKSLGGDVTWSLDGSCSHFIFQGKANDTDKEFRRARKGSMYVVSPEWLSVCKEGNRRMDEKLYPHTLNPNMILSLSQVQMNKHSCPPRKTSTSVAEPSVSPSAQFKASKEEVIEDQDLSMEEEELMIAEAEAIEEKEDSANSEEQREEFQRQFAQIMSTSGNDGSSKRKGRRQSANNDGNSNDLTSLGTDSRRMSRRSTRARRESKATKADAENKDKAVEPDYDSSFVITWDDATSRVCRENALARLREEGLKEESYEDEDQQKAEVKELTELGNFHASNDTESKAAVPPPIRLPHAKPAVAPERTEEHSQTNQAANKRVFLFTGLTEQERIDYGALIEQLGGEVADKTYYDRSCTHMIVGTPSKNEKYLAAVASGKWILHRSYMVECQKAGEFIEEEPHELNASMFPEKMSKASVLGNAPKRWREQLQQEDMEHRGAFDGWKVLMVVEEAKQKGLMRILEAGCGVVLANRIPFPASRSDATHLFLSTSKIKKVEDTIDYVELVSNGTLCLRPEYIAEFLIKSPSPDPSLFLIPAVKSILERIAKETMQSVVSTRSGSLQRSKNNSRDSTSSNSSTKSTRHR